MELGRIGEILCDLLEKVNKGEDTIRYLNDEIFHLKDRLRIRAEESSKLKEELHKLKSKYE